MQANRLERWWATGLITSGVVLLGIVFVAAFAIAQDPGNFYDEWVPAEGAEGPEASFDWTSLDLAAEFVDTSSLGEADIERWVWDFADGGESSEPNASHRFSNDGEYLVTLDLVDANGLVSRAESTVTVEVGATYSGEGVIGLNDLADKLTETAERSTKGAGVVVLVIGMFVVLTMIGGRLLRQGVRTLRPVPERISVKLRPKELEMVVGNSAFEGAPASERTAPPVAERKREPGSVDDLVETNV